MTVVDAMECEDVMQKQKFYKEKPKNKKRLSLRKRKIEDNKDNLLTALYDSP